jgi:hypothetical protein
VAVIHGTLRYVLQVQLGAGNPKKPRASMESLIVEVVGTDEDD